MTTIEARASQDLRPAASLQFKTEPEVVPWVFSALMNQSQVELFNGEFPEPFTSLAVLARLNQQQLILAAVLDTGPDFDGRYGQTIGNPQDLAPFLQRYPQHQFSPDLQQLTLGKNDQVFGAIIRTPDGKILIQRGGQIGQLALSSNTPVNDLSVHLDQFGLMLQRYISAIWKSSPETDQKQMQLILNLPSLPDGATKTYLSTFEIVSKGFSGHPRPLDLDTEIGGYPLVKAMIRSLFLDSTQPEVSRGFGTQPNGNKLVLVTGREGTGKSLFPKALDAMLRERFGSRYEYFRLPLEDILPQYGPGSVAVVRTMLDHMRLNEKNEIYTLLHVDHLEELVPPYQRAQTNGTQDVPNSEFQYSLQTRNPIVLALREFGADLGGDSRYVIVYGESRIPREELPEGVARTFRRAFRLDPTVKDLAEILAVQIRFTRKNAARVDHDPFSEGIDTQLSRITQSATGLTGRDIQQALLNVATRHKAAWDGTYTPITPDELGAELTNMVLERGGSDGPKRPLGFAFTRH